MGNASYPLLPGETKGSVHILQQAGDLLRAILGLQTLTETVWGDISITVLKDKEMSKNQRRMTNLLLSIGNISKAMYPGFHKGRKLLQISLI